MAIACQTQLAARMSLRRFRPKLLPRMSCGGFDSGLLRKSQRNKDDVARIQPRHNRGLNGGCGSNGKRARAKERARAKNTADVLYVEQDAAGQHNTCVPFTSGARSHRYHGMSAQRHNLYNSHIVIITKSFVWMLCDSQQAREETGYSRKGESQEEASHSRTGKS